MDRQHSFRPTVAVRCAQYSRREVARYPSFGPLLRVGSGLGRPCWCLVVSGWWSQWVVCLSIILQQLRTIRLDCKLSVSTCEVVGRGVCRQPIISGVCSQSGRNSLVSPESGGSTLAPVDGESIDSSSSSVCSGHSQCGCFLSLATQRSVRFQVDPSAGSGGSTGPLLASELRSICHDSESSDTSLLCSDGGPSVVWHRHASSMLESSSGIHLSSFSAGSSGLQRVLRVDELRGHSSGSMVASTGIFLRSPVTGSVPSGGLASSSRPSPTAPLCRYHLNPRLLRLHGWILWGVLRVCGVCPMLWLVGWLSIVDLPRSVSIHNAGWHVGVAIVQRVIWCPLFLWRGPRIFFCFCRCDKDLSPCSPTWDLYHVLVYLRVPVFEPLASQDLRTVTCKVLFLLSLATTKRVGELQVLSCSFAFCGKDLLLSYLLDFVAKTESERIPLPRIF